MKKIMCLSFFAVFLIAIAIGQNSKSPIKVTIAENEKWWGGAIIDGHMMPYDRGYAYDMLGNNKGNQVQPLLISNTGKVIWSEKPFRFQYTSNEILINSDDQIIQTSNGTTLKDAFLEASETYFPPSGKMPEEVFFAVPQYNTWIELTYNQNQEDVINYADGILKNGMPSGILMIDDNWQEDYGKWDFHEGRFSSPKLMIDDLHEKGFKVMLWVCPFVSPDCDVYRALEKKELFVKDDSGKPAMVRWWNGVSAVLDFTKVGAVSWFKSQLDFLMNEYGVDGFKFDAGDPRFYNGLNASIDILPNEHASLFGEIGLDYPLNEYRAMWKMGGQPLVQRLHDKNHDWEDLQKLIPQMYLEGLLGYPFSCPDMIGGGQYLSFLDGAVIDQELVVRSAQLHALMPMMQFSVAPWRVLDETHLNAVLTSVKIRDKFKKQIVELANQAAKTGEPIVRSLEYVFPHQGFAETKDQFMLGNSVLVAPVLKKGATERSVSLPKGKWMDQNSKKHKGSRVVNVEVDLNTIPYFIKID